MKIVKRRNGFILAALVAALAFTSMPTYAKADRPGWGAPDFGNRPHIRQHGPHGPGGGPHAMHDPGMRLLQMSQRLDLTAEQESQILELSQAYRADREAHRKEGKSIREQMQALRESDSFDETELRSALEKAQPHHIEGIVMHAKYRNELNQILTDEQKTQIDSFKSRMKDRFERHLKRGEPGARGSKKGRWG